MPEVVPGFLGGVSLTVSGLGALSSDAQELIETFYLTADDSYDDDDHSDNSDVNMINMQVSDRGRGGEVRQGGRGAHSAGKKHPRGELHRLGGLQPGAGYHHPGGVLQVSQAAQRSAASRPPPGCAC